MMKKIFKGILLTVSALLFVSCPSPMTEEIVLAASDKLAPIIRVVSPNNYDTYLSEVEFQVVVDDDAISSGDSRGNIASVSFSLSNDDFRGGKVNISADGSVSQDSSAGSSVIDYNSSTGAVNFSFSTIEPNILTGLLSVTVSVTDRNGNTTEERVSLDDSEGPAVDFTVTNDDGDENVYLGDQNVFLTGNIYNSNQDLTTSSDIRRISWNIANNITSEIIVDQDETYTDPYDTGSELSYYNSSSGLYENKISGYLLEADANIFSFDADTGEIAATIYMKSQLEALGTVSFSLTAEDLNGHETNETVLLTPVMDIPDLVGTDALSDTSFGHISLAQRTSDPIHIISDTNFDELTLGYQIKSGSAVTDIIYPDTSGVASTSYTINIDPNLIRNSGGSVTDDLDSIYTDGALISLIVLAENSASSSGQNKIALSLIEDSIGPVLSGFSLESNNSNAAYAASGDTLDLSFSFSENRALVSDTELSIGVNVGGHSASTSGGLVTSYSENGIAWTDWSSSQSSDADLPVTITLQDRLGNTNVYTNSSSEIADKIMYYYGDPALTNDVDISGSEVKVSLISSNSNPEYALAANTLSFSIASGRKLKVPALTVGGTPVSFTAASEGDTTFAVTTAALSTLFADDGTDDDRIPFSLVLTDLAGNELTVTQDSSPMSSPVTLDTIDPDETTASISLFATDGTGVVDSYLNSYANGDESVTLTYPGIDTNYAGYTYTLTGPAGFTTVTENSLQTSGSVSLSPQLALAKSAFPDGVYTMAFTFYDYAGNNSSKSFSFTVDSEAPTVSGIDFRSSYADHPQYVNQDSDLLLDFTATDSVSGVVNANSTATILGASVSLTDSSVTDGYSYSATKTISPSYDPSPDNFEVPVTINVEDAAGNVRSLTDADFASEEKVLFYSTKNSLSSYLSFTFNTGYQDTNRSTYWIKEGENITIAYSASRDIDISSLEVDSNSAALAGTTFTIALPSGFSDGDTVSFDVAFTDMAGNSYSGAIDTDSASFSVKNDSAVPDETKAVISLTPGTGVNGDYLNSYADASETVTVDGSLVDRSLVSYSYDLKDPGSASIQTGTDVAYDQAIILSSVADSWTAGDYTLQLTFKDSMGNTSSSHAEYVFTVDRDIPVPTINKSSDNSKLSISFDGFASVSGSDFSLIATSPSGSLITASESVSSGVVTYTFLSVVDGIATTFAGADYTLTVTPSAITDAAGNLCTGSYSGTYNSLAAAGITASLLSSSIVRSASAASEVLTSESSASGTDSSLSSHRYSSGTWSRSSSAAMQQSGADNSALDNTIAREIIQDSDTISVSSSPSGDSYLPPSASAVSELPAGISGVKRVSAVPENFSANDTAIVSAVFTELPSGSADNGSVASQELLLPEAFTIESPDGMNGLSEFRRDPAEVLTVAATPLLAGPVVEVDISNIPAEENENRTLLIIVLQTILILSVIPLSMGFIKVLRKLS